MTSAAGHRLQRLADLDGALVLQDAGAAAAAASVDARAPAAAARGPAPRSAGRRPRAWCSRYRDSLTARVTSAATAQAVPAAQQTADDLAGVARQAGQRGEPLELGPHQRLPAGVEHPPGAEGRGQPRGGLRVDRVEPDQPVDDEAVAGAVGAVEAGRVAGGEAADQRAEAVGVLPVEVGVPGQRLDGRERASRAGSAPPAPRTTCRSPAGRARQAAWKAASAASAWPWATSRPSAAIRSVMLPAAANWRPRRAGLAGRARSGAPAPGRAARGGRRRRRRGCRGRARRCRRRARSSRSPSARATAASRRRRAR